MRAMPIDDALNEMYQKDEQKQLKDLQRRSELEAQALREKLAALEGQVRKYKEDLHVSSARQQTEVIRAYLCGMSSFWPSNPKDSVDAVVVQFVASPDFLSTYENALILRNPVSRLEYVLMKVRQQGGVVIDIVNVDTVDFFARIAPLGLQVICPYFEQRKQDTFDACHIEEPPINALCSGKHYVCELFRTRTAQFAMGEIPYKKPPNAFKGPAVLLSTFERETRERDLQREIEAYWRGEDNDY